MGEPFICSGWLLSDIVAGWGDGIYEEDEVREGEKDSNVYSTVYFTVDLYGNLYQKLFSAWLTQ